ncbi:hypothetical protein AVEN_195133-1 [Araneus ventricosus]|uniref:Uncharacterized protein n=1 Tax=Araneus ventricosus TaxID=182803 RepID=A0A4Y2BHP0_ARAVE|nr:hypothetical protein AVEN_195133-1 [Araneus ventricosus]
MQKRGVREIPGRTKWKAELLDIYLSRMPSRLTLDHPRGVVCSGNKGRVAEIKRRRKFRDLDHSLTLKWREDEKKKISHRLYCGRKLVFIRFRLI